VERNRRWVHAHSEGRVGYIHIPDMRGNGYAEFHRGFLAEYDYPALLVDVRWNSGGFLSVAGLLLEKLARRRFGRRFSRWEGTRPYPPESPCGPMIALINEHTASSGDIFSYGFRERSLGLQIGERTWGGIIGYSARHTLVDGTRTTQPEFAPSFLQIENAGVIPDIALCISPQDFALGKDPQLERAIQEALRMIELPPSLLPAPGDYRDRQRGNT
jgi:tricorn protease